MNKIIIPSIDRARSINRWFLKNNDLLGGVSLNLPFSEGLLEITHYPFKLYFKDSEENVSFEVCFQNRDRDFAFKINKGKETMSFTRMPKEGSIDFEMFVGGRNELFTLFYGVMSLIVYHKDAVAESLVRTKEPTAPVKSIRHRSKSKGKSKPSKPQTQHIYVLQSFEPKEATQKLKAAKRKYTKPTTEVQVRGHYRTYPSGKRVWVKPFTKYNGKKSSKDKEYIL